MSGKLKRRKYLSSILTLGLVSTAGCLSSGQVSLSITEESSYFKDVQYNTTTKGFISSANLRVILKEELPEDPDGIAVFLDGSQYTQRKLLVGETSIKFNSFNTPDKEEIKKAESLEVAVIKDTTKEDESMWTKGKILEKSKVEISIE